MLKFRNVIAVHMQTKVSSSSNLAKATKPQRKLKKKSVILGQLFCTICAVTFVLTDELASLKFA